MIHTKDTMEKLLTSAEEKEREEDEIEAEEEDEAEEQEGDSDEEEEGEKEDDDKEKEEEAMPQNTDNAEKKIPLPAQPKDKKQSDVLNLNNEVVKMRKEVKRVRALIIRKLTRQIGALKKKKGKETEIERNQRRAARLLEEIHAMKVLSPDKVTKTALQKSLNFEQACKNPKSTISERAVARIATHPQFNKKIEAIKAAVKAFKEERMKGGKQGGKEEVQSEAGKVNPQSPDKRGGKQSEKEEEVMTVQLKEMSDSEEGDGVLKDIKDATVEKDTGKAAHSDHSAHSADTADVQQKETAESKSVKPELTKGNEVKETVKNEPQTKDAEKKRNPAVLPKKEEEDEESDLGSSDNEEKEYFDDSTEERFHKQSSQSEDSEDEFFVGKVSKFKKKKKQKSVEEEKQVEGGHEVKGESADKMQSELDELESRLKSKASFKSVFCSSLSGSKQGGGAGRGRGGDNFRGQRKPRGGSGFSRDFSKQSKFQKQVTGTERNSGSNHSKPCPEGRRPEAERGFSSAGRGSGRGRGRGDVLRQKIHHQAPQQALHPSWEASKKRKEQQGQILAFQGKKIKFDD